MSKWIDAGALLEKEERSDLDQYIDGERCYQMVVPSWAIIEAPSIDIVRCQDCKYWVYNFNGCSRNPCTEPWYATDFCNYGEREGE